MADDTDTLSQFLAFTGSADSNVARQFLEMSGDHLDTAVSLFMEVNGDGSINDGEEEERMRRGEECHVPITGGESIGDSSNRIDGDAIDGNEIGDEGSSAFSEPDYDYLVNDDDEQSNSGSGSDVASSPDYDHLGLDYDDLSATYLDDDGGSGNGIQEPDENILISASSKGPNTEAKATMGDCCYAEESDVGEEYILGTMMVRVLEARHVKVSSLFSIESISASFLMCLLKYLTTCFLLVALTPKSPTPATKEEGSPASYPTIVAAVINDRL